MVYVAGRKANAAKLPSEGLRLNASKSESRPDTTINSVLVTLCGMNMSVLSDFGARSGDKPCSWPQAGTGNGVSWSYISSNVIECESTKSSVDDLILGRGDVSYRAAFTLRVTESQPHLTWRFEDLVFSFSTIIILQHYYRCKCVSVCEEHACIDWLLVLVMVFGRGDESLSPIDVEIWEPCVLVFHNHYFMTLKFV